MRQEKSRKIKRKESKEKEETVLGASTIRGKAKTDLGNISFYLTVLELSKQILKMINRLDSIYF